MNAENERMFRAVYGALNDIDRAMYKPLETLRERYHTLTAAYDAVGERFATEAASLGLADWLRFAVLQRKFGLMRDDLELEDVRRLYQELERLGYPDVNPLISHRMIWANRLGGENEIDEARAVARQLFADVEEYRKRHPNMLVESFDDELDRFRQRLGL